MFSPPHSLLPFSSQRGKFTPTLEPKGAEGSLPRGPLCPEQVLTQHTGDRATSTITCWADVYGWLPWDPGVASPLTC